MTKSILTIAVVASLIFSAVAAEEAVKTQNDQAAPLRVAEIASIYKGVVILDVKLGEEVKKGQLLFQMNQDIFEAQKKYYENLVDFTKGVAEKAKELQEKHSISLDDYQQCQRDYTAAEQQLKKIEAQIAFSKYYAPFDGTVTQIIRYDGSGLEDNAPEMYVTEGKVNVDTANKTTLLCTRWAGILDVKVKVDEKVKKGQLLFKTDMADIEAQKLSDASIEKYNKALFERRSKLIKTHSVSLLDYYQSEVDYEKAQLAVKIDDIQIKQSSVYSPFDGVVTKIYRFSGSGNGEGKPVLEITEE